MSSKKLDLKNIKLMIEFKSLLLSKYLVGTGLVKCENERSKVSAIAKSKLLYIKWNRYSGFQSLSLILKSLVIIKTFQMLASVSFRYFKANWLESE